jgi:hypothetical protein
MKHLLAAVAVAPTLTSCLEMLILGEEQLIPEESTPNLATGPLGVHREDSISLSDGSWEVVG